MHDSLADLKGETRDSYLVAHELKTGRQRWYIKRATEADAEECDAYTTPVFQMVGKRHRDARLRRQSARFVRSGHRAALVVSARPQGGPHGHRADGGRRVRRWPRAACAGPMVAVKLSAAHQGKLNNRAIEWTQQTGTPDSCSPGHLGRPGVHRHRRRRGPLLQRLQRPQVVGHAAQGASTKPRRSPAKTASTSSTRKACAPWSRPRRTSRSWSRTRSTIRRLHRQRRRASRSFSAGGSGCTASANSAAPLRRAGGVSPLITRRRD